MKVLHILYSGLGGHGSVFFSSVEADPGRQNQYEALFFGIEDIRPEYIKMAEEKGISWYFVKKKPGLDLNAYKKIAKIIKQSAPEILFLHGGCYFFPAWYASLIASHKIKIVVRETVPDHLKTTIDWVGLVFALIFARKTVFLNKEYRDIVKKKLPLFFAEKRTTVIGNGVDMNLFKPAPRRDPAFVKLGMLGRLVPGKDFVTLIEAFSIVEKQLQGKQAVELYIAGDGTRRSELEELSKDLLVQNKVKFLGMLPESSLPAFINSLDIYVHATIVEMMSTAIVQVMACDIPIIATDVFGVNNMIENNKNGLLVPFGDKHKLAEAILFYIKNRELASAHAKKALSFAVENYSNKEMFRRYQAVFEEK